MTFDEWEGHNILAPWRRSSHYGRDHVLRQNIARQSAVITVFDRSLFPDDVMCVSIRKWHFEGIVRNVFWIRRSYKNWLVRLSRRSKASERRWPYQELSAYSTNTIVLQYCRTTLHRSSTKISYQPTGCFSEAWHPARQYKYETYISIPGTRNSW